MSDYFDTNLGGSPSVLDSNSWLQPTLHDVPVAPHLASTPDPAPDSSPSAFDWFNAASPLLGKVLGGGGSVLGGSAMPTGPSSASGFYAPNTYDGSNWTVTTGRSNATVKAASASGASGGSASSSGLLSSIGSSWPAIVGFVLVGIVLWKRG